MLDPRFREAAQIDLSYRQGARSVKTNELQSVATAFVSNVDRVVALAEMLPLSIRLTDQYRHDAELRNAAEVNPPLYRNYQVVTSAEIWAEMGQLFDSPLPPDKRAAVLFRRYDWLRKWVIHPVVEGGMAAVLAAQITGTWTAFEPLAGDLWTESVLLRPDPLAVASFPKAFPPDRAAAEEKARRSMRRLDGIRS